VKLLSYIEDERFLNVTVSVIEFIKFSKEHNSPILKREAGGASETLVPIH